MPFWPRTDRTVESDARVWPNEVPRRGWTHCCHSFVGSFWSSRCVVTRPCDSSTLIGSLIMRRSSPRKPTSSTQKAIIPRVFKHHGSRSSMICDRGARHCDDASTEVMFDSAEGFTGSRSSDAPHSSPPGDARGSYSVRQRPRDEGRFAGCFLSIARGRPFLNGAVAFDEAFSQP